MVESVIFIAVLIVGIIGITYFSRLAVTHAASLASRLGISSLVIGITLVSIGTDIAEIFNSIIACSIGHGDIDVGDSVGSSLTQLTLVFGLLPIICGNFIVKRKEFLIIGSCLVLSLTLIFTVVEKGYFTRLDALFMMSSFIFYTMITYNVTKSDLLETVDLFIEKAKDKKKNTQHFLIIASLAFIGVAISSFFIIQSIIGLSKHINLPEFVLSFLLLAVGTSLPELAVDITAIRKKQYDIAIGDIIGSCIVDSTISIAIGQFLFPQTVSAALAVPAILYTIIVSIIVIILVSSRQKMDKKAGIILIMLYLGAFPFLLGIAYQ